MNDDSHQKFIARQSITMEMKLTLEEHSLLQEWSAIVPTLYMLDICVVAATKLTEKSLKDQQRKADLIAHLRNLDRESNSFSYLLALMEKVSDSRGILTVGELEKQILFDVLALRGFFKTARVVEPDAFLIDFLRELMGKPIEVKRAEYLEFLEKLNNHFQLQNAVSPKQRLGKAKEIIIEAKSLNISAQHHIVIIALACLYGNQSAKKLMKFKSDSKKFDAENILSDISLIYRFATIRLEMEQHFPRVKFITDDTALSDLFRRFKPRVLEYSGKIDRQEQQLTMDVELENLLTEIKEDEYRVIIELLLS